MIGDKDNISFCPGDILKTPILSKIRSEQYHQYSGVDISVYKFIYSDYRFISPFGFFYVLKNAVFTDKFVNFQPPFHFLDVQNVGEAHHVRDFVQGLKLLSDLIDRVPRVIIKQCLKIIFHYCTPGLIVRIPHFLSFLYIL